MKNTFNVGFGAMPTYPVFLSRLVPDAPDEPTRHTAAIQGMRAFCEAQGLAVATIENLLNSLGLHDQRKA